MHLFLRTSATKKPLGSYVSTVVPRAGEHVNLAHAVSFRVVDVYYHIHDQENDRVDLEVAPVDDVACQYIRDALYQSL